MWLWYIGSQAARLTTIFTVKDILKEAGIELLPMPKKNTLRPVPPFFTIYNPRFKKLWKRLKV